MDGLRRCEPRLGTGSEAGAVEGRPLDALRRYPALLVRAAGRLCAVPIAHVVEVMRALPVEPIPGAPSFVPGLAIIRGAPMPVVDLGLLTGGRSASGRFVTLRLGDRRAALAVDAVVGVRAVDAFLLQELPPLLRDAGAEVVDAIGVIDTELLVSLRAGRLVPEDVWQAVAAGEAPP